MADWVDRTLARMRALKLTQADLQDALGVSTRGAVGHYLNRRRQPNVDQLIALARVLQMTMDELYLGRAMPPVAHDFHSSHVREVSAKYSLLAPDAREAVDKLLDALSKERKN